jgi:ribonuclease HII
MKNPVSKAPVITKVLRDISYRQIHTRTHKANTHMKYTSHPPQNAVAREPYSQPTIERATTDR